VVCDRLGFLGGGVVGDHDAAPAEVAVNAFEPVDCPQTLARPTLLEHPFPPLPLQHRQVTADQLQGLPDPGGLFLGYPEAVVDECVLCVLVLLLEQEERVVLEEHLVFCEHEVGVSGYLLEVVLGVVQKLDYALVGLLPQLLHP